MFLYKTKGKGLFYLTFNYRTFPHFPKGSLRDSHFLIVLEYPCTWFACLCDDFVGFSKRLRTCMLPFSRVCLSNRTGRSVEPYPTVWYLRLSLLARCVRYIRNFQGNISLVFCSPRQGLHAEVAKQPKCALPPPPLLEQVRKLPKVGYASGSPHQSALLPPRPH